MDFWEAVQGAGILLEQKASLAFEAGGEKLAACRMVVLDLGGECRHRRCYFLHPE